MTQRIIINKNSNIYSFPNEFESNLRSVTLGDLHGNSVKLLHLLFRHKLIQFKEEVLKAHDAYQQFVDIYEQYGDVVEKYMENRTNIKFLKIKENNTNDVLALVIKQIANHVDTTTNSQEYIALNQHYVNLNNTLEHIKIQRKTIEQKNSVQKEKLLGLIALFNQFMSTIKCVDSETLLRLIGDEVADRGHCDYFTLRILEFFQLNKGKLTIITSNHGCEFIHAYEQLIAGRSFTTLGCIRDTQKTSFVGLHLLLEHEIIKPNDLLDLINTCYKPVLKIIDYSLSETGITLFSHAPIRFDEIELLSKGLGVNYADATKEALAESIEKINKAFKSYVERNAITSLIRNENNIDVTNMSEEDRAAWPVIYFIWNRWSEAQETDTARPSRKNDYDIFYVHGHDTFQSLLTHILNLDTLSGKNSRKTDLEIINNAFQFILENHRKGADKSAQEYLIRNIDRYKALNTDEYQLKSYSLNSEVQCNDVNVSAIALSLLGGPIQHSHKTERINQPSIYEQSNPGSSSRKNRIIDDVREPASLAK